MAGGTSPIYRAGKVRRWHTHNSLNQTVADHSHGVIMLILLNHPDPSVSLLRAAAFHDMGELMVGDVPTYSKRASVTLRNELEKLEGEALAKMGIPMPDLTEDEQLWLKWADLTELVNFVELNSVSAKDVTIQFADIIAAKEKLDGGIRSLLDIYREERKLP
jgi:5'-deoxynucleotidase YfbR-like HD superfamily hydrolase